MWAIILPYPLQQIKDECSKGSGPKQAISDVSARFRGVISATDSCEIPRNEQQVTKLKRQMKYSEYSSVSQQGDELAVVLHQVFVASSIY